MTVLRVLHVIGGDDTGGAMSYLLPLLAALRAEGCDARLLCLGSGGLADAATARSLPCTVIPMSHPWDARMLSSLRVHLAGDEWQIVHTHGMRANLPVRLVLRTMTRRPLLFTTIHSDLVLDYSSPLKSRGYALLDRATRAGVDAFCCVSADLARRLVARGVPPSRVHVVHPGIELAEVLGSFVSAKPGAASAAAGSSSSAPRPVVGTVARLVPVKDLELLLEAVALVAKTLPEVKALIVGEGPERAALERRASAEDLQGRVDFLGRVAPAWPAMARFDVFASGSESEGVPISVLEAMAVGLPVVATAVGGLSEVIKDGETGFLIRRERDRAVTAAALAGRMVELLADPALRRMMGDAGRKRVEADFSSRASGRTMQRIYEQTAASKACWSRA